MSKFYFVFFSYVLSLCYVIECGVVNTGTVLFSSRDISRQCWHPEEIAVLTTRMILQDLLPEVNVLEINNNDYVDDIVEYFRLLFEVVQKSTQGRSRHITMLALSDLIGGYLQHAVLPMARYAYYAGVIDFPSMEKLIQLYEELKWFLRTNGQGWAKPLQPRTEYDIEPIDLSKEGIKGNKSCCRNLIYYQRPPIKREANSEEEKPTKLFFPIPFFDSKVRPSAIAVPFRRFALRNIESKRAAYMVLKYYISVHNCLNDLHADKSTSESFQNSLYTWLEQNVMPKLKDDKFYSAFGGIMRVEESLKLQGAKFASNTGNTECFENEGDQELGAVPGGESSSRSSIILISMLVTIFIWFIIGTLFICYRIRANSKKGAQMNVSSGTGSSSSFGSSSKWSSSKRTVDTCKCCTTATEKSAEINSSVSSEFDKEETRKTGKKCTPKSLLKSFTFADKCSKKEPYGRTCFCDGPPTIDPKHSLKLLPSIPEMSENSSSKRDDRIKLSGKSRKISFNKSLCPSSREDNDMEKNKSKIRICVPRLADVDVTACPRYDDKAVSLSSFKTKSSNGNDLGIQISEPGIEYSIEQPEIDIKEDIIDTNGNTTEETSDNTGITANSPHIYACHSSLTGNYTTDQRFQSEKPFIFGYDFQTSSSSELSDEESDVRTSTTK
ncbi:uncharacterized protein LOC108908531 [Anoplophora glabripennis]|uniref:uncharacterized protein LOC108908531 n=1 Tax=Anoplophora glabripennis TaxID=217634 RepID=UPI000874C814|nr:uncharacterized protein LOC108908531 [Anoplophora glabripennis]